MEYAFWAMMGWCGTKWPGWRPGPRPGPDPEPWWNIVDGLIGAVGGIAAMTVFEPMVGEAGLLASGMVAFFGGTFAGSAVDSLMGMGKRTGPQV